jgi:hypothetical protein
MIGFGGGLRFDPFFDNFFFFFKSSVFEVLSEHPQFKGTEGEAFDIDQ